MPRGLNSDPRASSPAARWTPPRGRGDGEGARRRLAATVAALLALALLPTPAAALDPAQVVMPTDPRALAGQEAYGYADAVIAGDTVYLSGVVIGLRPGDTDLEAAFARAFKRIAAILGRAGSGLDQVVEITSFHTDIEPQVAAMAKAKKAVIPGPHPAWTAIGVARLLEPTGLTEIKIVARTKGGQGSGRS